jgi:radical SAM superfamily enzyme YgiQ (UPF0313 family)
MKAVAKRGVRYVWFVDDNFRLGKSDLDGFCRHLLNEGVETRWMTMIRADKLEDVDVDLLRRSGCIEVQLGLESADPRILSNMNKRADPEVYARVVERLLEAGINCSCYFIFGFPGETNETAYRTRSFIRRIEHPELDGSLSWSLIPFSVVPMSPIYELDMRKRYGLEGYLRDWRHHTMDSEEAKFHAREALSELDQSSPIFRGDNLDMLLGLGARQRKRFLITRHRLSKSALKHELEKGEIVREFSRSMS